MLSTRPSHFNNDQTLTNDFKPHLTTSSETSFDEEEASLKRIVTNDKESSVVMTSSSSSSLTNSYNNEDASASSASINASSFSTCQPSPSSFEVMKKMKGLDRDLRPSEYQEKMNQASAALALSALFNGGPGSKKNVVSDATATAVTGPTLESDDEKRKRVVSPQNSVSNQSNSATLNTECTSSDNTHLDCPPPTAKRAKVEVSEMDNRGGFAPYSSMPPPSGPYPFVNSPWAVPSYCQGPHVHAQQYTGPPVTSMLHRQSPIPFVTYSSDTNHTLAMSCDHLLAETPSSNNDNDDEKSGQSLTSRTIHALHNKMNAKSSYVPIYPKMNNMNQYHPQYQHHPMPSTTYHPLPHHLTHNHDLVNGAVTPSPRHAVKPNNSENKANMNHSRESNVSSSVEMTPFQLQQIHHLSMNGRFSPTSSFITPAKCQSMTTNDNNMDFSQNSKNVTISQQQQLKDNANTKIDFNHPNYNRKDKSLGVLCENFIDRYTAHFAEDVIQIGNGSPPPALSIDEAAQSLCVERRRIYDIINILEAIRVVSRKCKNMYYWYGLGGLTDTFCILQKEGMDVFPDEAEKNGFNLSDQPKYAPRKAIMDTLQVQDGDNMPSGVAMLLAADQVHARTLNDMTTNIPTNEKIKSLNAKEKSLAKLSQKFIQLFLVGNDTVAMSDASMKILGPTLPNAPESFASVDEEAKFRASNNKLLKTKIRRLYDVANVLVSIGIITKLNGGNNMNNEMKHRPSFRWTYQVSPKELLSLQNVDES